MFGRKEEIIRQLRSQVEHYLALLESLCKQKEDLMEQVTKLKVEKAVLEERLKRILPLIRRIRKGFRA